MYYSEMNTMINKRPELTDRSHQSPKHQDDDGPLLPFRPYDRLLSYPNDFIAHHVVESPFQVFNVAGTIFGGAFSAVLRSAALPSAFAVMGTAGFALGCCGSALGLARTYSIAAKEGTTVAAAQSNAGLFNELRTIDMSSLAGVAVAGASLVAAGGPKRLKLSYGFLGVIQAACLGSALGTAAFGCVASVHDD